VTYRSRFHRLFIARDSCWTLVVWTSPLPIRVQHVSNT
jgi:hypothetical protein